MTAIHFVEFYAVHSIIPGTEEALDNLINSASNIIEQATKGISFWLSVFFLKKIVKCFSKTWFSVFK